MSIVFTPYAALSSDDQAQYRALYESAFPAGERRPFSEFLLLRDRGALDLSAIVDRDALCGLAMVMHGAGGVCLSYFAVSPDRRGGGLGGRALDALLRQYAGQDLVLEIEVQDPAAANAAQRARRKAFYLRHGLKETGLFVNSYQTEFEILTPSGRYSFSDYDGMLRAVLTPELYRAIDPRPSHAPGL